VTIRWPQAVLTMLAVGALSACSSGGEGDVTGAAGVSGPDAGTDASATGAAGTTGAAGAVGAAGTGGGAGTTGAAGSTGAAGTGASLPCGVVLSSPGGFDDLAAGPNEKVRVRGRIVGTVQPAKPEWTWKVTIDSTGEVVTTTTPDPKDPTVIEFPIARADRYVVAATVQVTPHCGGVERVTTTFAPAVSYHVRITPPREHVDLAPYEGTIKLRAGTSMQRNFYFDPTATVSIDLRTPASQAIGSYIRITSPGHFSSREGDTRIRGFTTALVAESSWLYDVLIVPADAGVAPLLFSGRTAARVAVLPAVVDPDVPVVGSLAVEGGAPVKNAAVLLRDGALPSTLGTTDAAGAFALRARAGAFSAAILPAGGALPEARVGDAERINLPFTADTPVRLDFKWRADLGARALVARFTRSDGSPAADIDVRLDSAAGALPNVGSVRVTNNGSGDQTIVATGAVHRTAKTDANGNASFMDLPRAKYQLMGVPPVGSTDGITVTPVDLTAAAPASASVTVPLARKVAVTGRLVNFPEGTRVIVVDDEPVPVVGHDFAPAVLGAQGAYALSLDPNHAYHLLADPPAGRRVSRVPLGSVATQATPIARDVRALPRMLTFAGRVYRSDGATNVGAAKVQVFCIGGGPECVDTNQLPGKDPLPLIEGLTDSQGSFALWVPDPSITACTPGQDQTCNEDASVATPWGTCSDVGTCTCFAGGTLVPDTGRCSR
jgi:hypothetical protein